MLTQGFMLSRLKGMAVNAEELGHCGGQLKQSANVDAVALLQEGRGCIGHNAAEVTHHINETPCGQQ